MDNGNVLTNEGDIAECMNEYFAPVFTAENFSNFPSFDQVIKDKDLSFIHCSPKYVSKILSELKPRKSARTVYTSHDLKKMRWNFGFIT